MHQLKRLRFIYCDISGSSRGLREYLCSSVYSSFQTEHPHLAWQYSLKRSRPPYLSCLYLNGFIKDVPLANKAMEDVHADIITAYSQFGKRSSPFHGRKVYTAKESVQGKWRDNMWSAEPSHELEEKAPLPQYIYDVQIFMKPSTKRIVKRDPITPYILQSENRDIDPLVKL